MVKREVFLPTGREKSLAPIRENAGVVAEYHRTLERLVDAMSNEIEEIISKAYRRAEGKIVQDSSPMAGLRDAVAEMTRKWEEKFDNLSPDIAKRFVKQADEHSQRSTRARLKSAGIAIEFRPTRRMQDIISAAVSENTKLIKSISDEYLDDVAGIVNRGIMEGHNLGKITEDLKARYHITHRRAALIARQESRNANTAMNRARQLDLGIEEGEWVHSGGGREPRESHVAAGRKRLRFKLTEGAYIDGEYIMPGQKINCRCNWRPVLRGWND